MKNACLAVALLLFAGHVFAVNRCTGPDGRVSFQDEPCAGKGGAIVIRPASGAAPAAAASGANEAQRINAQIDRSAAARRVVELDAQLIPNVTSTLARHQARCARDREALERSQYAYRQNLYGKTHAAQVASEMVQLTLDCEREEKALQAQLSSLQAERQRQVAAAGN